MAEIMGGLADGDAGEPLRRHRELQARDGRAGIDDLASSGRRDKIAPAPTGNANAARRYRMKASQASAQSRARGIIFTLVAPAPFAVASSAVDRPVFIGGGA